MSEPKSADDSRQSDANPCMKQPGTSHHVVHERIKGCVNATMVTAYIKPWKGLLHNRAEVIICAAVLCLQVCHCSVPDACVHSTGCHNDHLDAIQKQLPPENMTHGLQYRTSKVASTLTTSVRYSALSLSMTHCLQYVVHGTVRQGCGDMQKKLLPPSATVACKQNRALICR